MTFGEAVRSGFDHYVGSTVGPRDPPSGGGSLWRILVSIAANIIDLAIGAPVFSAIVGLGLLLPGLSVSIREAYDTNRTGWWILIYLIPLIGLIVLLVFLPPAGRSRRRPVLRRRHASKYGNDQLIDRLTAAAQPGPPQARRAPRKELAELRLAETRVPPPKAGRWCRPSVAARR